MPDCVDAAAWGVDAAAWGVDAAAWGVDAVGGGVPPPPTTLTTLSPFPSNFFNIVRARCAGWVVCVPEDFSA